MTKEWILNYAKNFGTDAAIDEMLFAGPEKFDGELNEYKDLLVKLLATVYNLKPAKKG